MSVTSLTMRGVFPGDVREMKNQEQNYHPYGDDESPIDLSKKATISKRKQSESINDKQYQEEYIRGDSPALSEEENEKRYEFFHAIQKMSAIALPPFLHPWFMVNPKDLASVSGTRIGLPANASHGGSGYHAYGGSNPCILNPFSLASLYPLVSEQCGVPFSMVSYANGSHGESVSSRLIPRSTSDPAKPVNKKEKAWHSDQQEYNKDWKTLHQVHKDFRVTDSAESETSFRDKDNCHLEEDGNSHNRCASTPPDADCKNRQKILSIRHLRESWKSDSKLLASKATKSHNKSKSRFASDGSLDHAILRLHFAKNKRSANFAEKDFVPPSNFAAANVRRSHSCSDLSQFKQCVSKKKSTAHRYHSGYASDNETLYSSPFSSSQCSLYSAGSKKESTIDLGSAYKRKSYAPSDDSDVESEKLPLSVGSESPPGKKPFQDAKRLKSLRSLSEPSIRKKVAPPDYVTPTDLSMKSSVPLGKNPDAFLQHSPQTEIPWRVYGYYNHLLQRFREEEILKRHSAYHTHDHHKEQYPIGSEAGLSPPPSPSPENYSPLTSAGAWMESPRSGDYGRDESPDSSLLSSDPNNRKRPCRALTGKHVKHGTGASPATLITLRQKIQERQKAKELGIAFDKGDNGVVKSKTGQNKKSHHSRSTSNKRSKQGTKFLPSTSLQSKDQNV